MTTISLPPIVNVAAAEALAEKLRATAGPVTLDGSSVARIGIAGLQLLLSAQASARTAGHGLTIVQPSPALMAAATTAGAVDLLPLYC